jgi:hypothetical protein
MKRIWIYTGLFLGLTTGICSAEVLFKAEVKRTVVGMKVYATPLKKLAHETRLERLHDVLRAAEMDVPQEANIVRTDDFMGINDHGIESLINLYGSEIVFTNLPGLRLTEMTGALPDDREAVAIAQKYLASTELVDLRRGELFVGHVGGLMQSLATPRTNFEPEKKAVSVYFNRKIDGFPVMNRGSHITVMIGDGFTPVNLHYHWREVGKAERAATRSTAIPLHTIKASIEKDLSRVHDLNRRIVIEKIYPVYYDRGWKFIQPAYCYEGSIIGEMEEMPVLGYVPGLIDPPEPVHHPGYDPFTEKPDSTRPEK